LVRSKRKKSVQRGTEQRRWSIVGWRQNAGEAVEGIESGPEAGGERSRGMHSHRKWSRGRRRRSRGMHSIPIYIVMKHQREEGEIEWEKTDFIKTNWVSKRQHLGRMVGYPAKM
jgi:hypothetical protein